MFKAECDKIVKYDLQVSEDIVKFCQWIFNDEQNETFDDFYAIEDFLDAIANKAPSLAIRNGEMNIEYK